MKNRITFLILLIFALIPIFTQSPFILTVLISFMIFTLFASSLNIVVGYLGELSFGHAVFFGVGAYAAVLWQTHMPGGMWVGAIVAMIVCGLVALFISSITFRTLSGIYFAIVTFGIAEIFRIITLQWIDFTRGPMGISSIPRPAIGGFTFSSDINYYYLVLVVLALVTIFLYLTMHSAFGRTLVSIREGKDVSLAVGVNVVKYKTIALILSGIIAGLSGVLYAFYYSVITPDLLGLHYTTIALIIVIVGGKGNLLGPFLGALLYIILPEFLNFDPVINLLIFGIILLIFVIYMPFGLVEGFSKLFNLIRNGVKRGAV